MKCKNCVYFNILLNNYPFGQCLCHEHEQYLKFINYRGVLKVNESDSCKYYLPKNVKCEFKEIK